MNKNVVSFSQNNYGKRKSLKEALALLEHNTLEWFLNFNDRATYYSECGRSCAEIGLSSFNDKSDVSIIDGLIPIGYLPINSRTENLIYMGGEEIENMAYFGFALRQAFLDQNALTLLSPHNKKGICEHFLCNAKEEQTLYFENREFKLTYPHRSIFCNDFLQFGINKDTFFSQIVRKTKLELKNQKTTSTVVPFSK
jgi:hypothetical protein